MGLASKSVGTFVTKIVIVFARFAIGIFIARVLGPEGKGVLYLLVTSVMMCATLGNFGLGQASVYFIGRDHDCVPKVVGNLFIITVALGLSVGISGWIFLEYARPEVYTQIPIWLWLVAAVIVPIHLMRSLLMQVLSGMLRIKEVNIIEVAAVAFQVPLLVVFVVILDKGIGGAFLAHACSDLTAAVGFFTMVLRYDRRPKRPDWTLLRDSLRFGVKSYVSNLMRQLSLRLSVFLLTAFAIQGVQATGVYSIAISIAEVLLFVPQSIRLSLFPMVASSTATEANRLTSQASRHTAFLTTVCGVVIAVLAPVVIPRLYGQQFADAVPAVLVLIPGVVLLALAHIFYGDLTGRGKPEATTISALLSLVVVVLLDLMLIPHYGILGAAIASTCAYSIEFAVAGAFFIFYSGLTWKDVLLFRRSDLRHYTWGHLNNPTKTVTTT